MSRYTEDMFLACKSIEELERIKQKVLRIREEEDIRRNCHHPIACYLDTVYGYECYKQYLCLRCGQVVEDAYKTIAPTSFIKSNIVAFVLKTIYREKLSLGTEDREIVTNMVEFNKFLKERESLKDIDMLSDDEIKEIIFEEYQVYVEVSKILRKSKKK